MTNLLTPEALLEYMKDSSRKVGKTFRSPDDDWVAHGFIVGRKGAVQVVAMPFSDEEEKRVSFLGLAGMAKEAEAQHVGLVTSCWVAEMALDDMPLKTMPSEHPQRKEMLLAQVLTRKEIITWHAQIFRHKRTPPILGAWAPLPGELFTVGFIGAVRDALAW